MHVPSMVWFIVSVLLIVGAGIYLVSNALTAPLEERRRRVIVTVSILAFLLVWLVFFYFLLPEIMLSLLGRSK